MIDLYIFLHKRSLLKLLYDEIMRIRRIVTRVILIATGIILITFVLLLSTDPLLIVTLSSLLASENSLIIELPSSSEALNKSVNQFDYYVEIWAVVPEGIVEVMKTRISGSGTPFIKLSFKEMRDVVRTWLEFYKIHGKTWRPSLILQFSTYDSENKTSLLFFGASIVYDPEFFIDPVPRVVKHVLSTKKFPLIERFKTKNQNSSEAQLSSCDISLQGLPGPCVSDRDCNCCISDRGFTYFTRLALGEKIFDSSDPSIPSNLRDKVPLAIMYLDPSSSTQYFDLVYTASNVNKWIFRMTILDRRYNKTIWGDASGELTQTSVEGVVSVSSMYPVGMIYWYGSFKLYTAYGYTCCYERLCTGSGDIALTCESNGFSALLMLVSYVINGVYKWQYTINEAPINITYFRSRLSFSVQYVPGGSTVTIQRDPYELRINPVEILMAIILARLGVPWYYDALITLAIDYMPIAVEIVRTQGTQETLKLYNGGLYATSAYIAKLQAVYLDPTRSLETFTPLFVDIR